MNTSKVLLILISLAILLHSSKLADASVEDECKIVTAADPNVDYNFCVTSLQADPRSGSADAKELAIIAANLTVANATSTLSKIEKLLGDSKIDSATKGLLNQCSSFYKDVVTAASGAIKAIGSGSMGDAKKQLTEASDKPQDCDNLLFEAGKNYLLKKEDNDCTNLASIAQNIVAKLQ
ncbi:PMEI [Musa troglodytarum]|uniref:PMEI n=1 Tax=Musa troglodytarum TaxID=320322 RepID=A0A9E7JQJ5_9LILI|nr:PMEI [Musa troglodytarum]